VTNPTLPALVEILYGSAGAKAPTNFPRNDLVAAFLTGVKGVNQPATVTASEMLRLNTSIARWPWVAESPWRDRRRQRRLPERPPSWRRRGRHRAARGDGQAVHAEPGLRTGRRTGRRLHFTDGAYLDDSFFTPASRT
jgi:hypothetical protein